MDRPRVRNDTSSAGRIPASIEVTAKQVIETGDLAELFPGGVRVYVPDLGAADAETPARACRRLRDLGYEPVPHIAARRLTTQSDLENRIAALTQEAGVSDVLIIGGGLTRPAGAFASSLDVLETGLLDRYGITKVGIAGHPEGSPDFPDDVAFEVLRLKQAFGERTGAEARIVTQFGFNPRRAIEWAETLGGQGIDLPVHLGIAGPARLTTLLKYAAMCGVGNSIDFLKKQARSLTALASNQSPETVLGPIEDHWRSSPGSAIRQIHVFPFGGIKKAAEWLETRGSWRNAGSPPSPNALEAGATGGRDDADFRER